MIPVALMEGAWQMLLAEDRMGLQVPHWDIRVGSPSAGQLSCLLASVLGQAVMAVSFGSVYDSI